MADGTAVFAFRGTQEAWDWATNLYFKQANLGSASPASEPPELREKERGIAHLGAWPGCVWGGGRWVSGGWAVRSGSACCVMLSVLAGLLVQDTLPASGMHSSAFQAHTALLPQLPSA